MDTGIDITSIERIERLSGEDAFSGRVFTPAELAHSAGQRRPGRRLAGLFSAKEAFMKALGTGWTAGVSWQDIEVLHTEGRPTLTLSGKAAELNGNRAAHLSIAYSEKLAVASVIID